MNIGLSRNILLIPEIETLEMLPSLGNLYFEIRFSRKYLEEISISEIIDLCEYTGNINIVGIRLDEHVFDDLDLVEKCLYILDELKARYLVTPIFIKYKYNIDKLYELTANYNKTICFLAPPIRILDSIAFLTKIIDEYTKSVFSIAYNLYSRMSRKTFNEIGENLEYIKIIYFINFHKDMKLGILDRGGEVNIFRLINFLNKYRYRYYLILDYPDTSINSLIKDIERIMEFFHSIKEKL